MGVQIRISDPEAHCFESAGAFWTVIGTGPTLPAGLEDRFARDLTAAEKICCEVGDAVVLKVDVNQGRAVKVTLWKGLTSGYELYYTVRSGGEVVVSDYFRNLLCALPQAERIVSDNIVVDHFLFRTVPGTQTYCQNVSRTGHGEQVTILPDTGLVTKRLFDRVDGESELAREEDYLDWIDGALESTLEPRRSQPNVTNLFSGGVDSTLMHTYLGSATRGLYVERAGGTADYEAKYADQAATLMNIPLDTVTYDMSAILGDLADAVRMSGVPPLYYQSAFYRPVWRGPYQKFVTGLHSDRLFGFGVRSTLIAARFASGPGNLFLRAAKSVLGLTPRLNAIEPQARELRQPLDDPYGLAGAVELRCDPDLLEQGFGTALVRERLERRLAYTLERMPPPDPGAKLYMRHLDLAHLISNFCEDDLSKMRHRASAHGKTVIAPFQSRQMLASARRIPLKHRYAKGLDSKYLVKNLLKRRLPSYPIGQRKGQSNVPFDQLYPSGPLAEIWNQYAVPAWLAEFGAGTGEVVPNGLIHSAIFWAVWEREVLSNPDLKTDSDMRTFTWSETP